MHTPRRSSRNWAYTLLQKVGKSHAFAKRSRRSGREMTSWNLAMPPDFGVCRFAIHSEGIVSDDGEFNDTGLDSSELTISTEAFGRSHISMSRFSAIRKLGLTVDMCCVTCRKMDECRTFSKSRRTRILSLILDPLSIYTQNGKVCTADASVRCFLSFALLALGNLDITYLSLRTWQCG